MDKGNKQYLLEEQTELIPFDIEEVLPLDDNGNEDTPYKVRVVAPCDLPSNYKLLVTTNDGTKLEVLVPENGVRRNQTFEAEKWQPNPIEGRFGDDLWSFGSGSEGRWYQIACFCRGLAIGGLMETLQLNVCAIRSTTSIPNYTFEIVAFLWFVYITTIVAYVSYVSYWGKIIRAYLSDVDNHDSNPPDPPTTEFFAIVGLIYMCVTIYFIVIQTMTRMAFRSKYKIPGGCCVDCLVSSFCNCCASLQMYRHMKRSGDRPTRFESLTGIECQIV